jgi:hypothetical protein
VQIAKLVKSLKTDKPAKANQSVKEQMQTELQQLKQKGLLTAYKTDDPCEVCEARLKLKLDVKHDPQIQALQEQIQKTFAELDKVDDELRQRRLDLGRTQEQKGKQMSVMKVQTQIARANKYAESLKIALAEKPTLEELMNSPM